MYYFFKKKWSTLTVKISENVFLGMIRGLIKKITASNFKLYVTVILMNLYIW